MEAGRKRNIRSGEGYTHLFPKAEGENKTIRKNADVTHTVAFIPKVVHETLHHTKAIAKRLKGTTTYETCSNIWHFVYQHISYRKDQDGYEQIRSPARAWHDREKGVDCDCYSVFISSILTNLQIPHILRITKYHRDYFQHIYPVVVLNGKEIPIDCVTDQFNYEVPYSEKKDYPMDLQYLNGFDESDLGQLFGKKKAKAKTASAILPVPKKTTSLLSKLKGKKPDSSSPVRTIQPKEKKKGLIKKVVNKVNKVNPATVLLRNGILAAMKLNVKNIAKRLRWSYLTPQAASSKGIDPAKFQRLLATRQKLEKIFYGAGGNEANLKKAILGGKGNGDKAVNGLEGFADYNMEYMNAYTPLRQLLGRDVYYSENIEGFSGLGQLGEPVTLASVGAAMGVLAGIVAALKQIGDIFPKKTKGSEDFDEKTNEAAENNLPIPGTTPVPQAEAKAALQQSTTSITNAPSSSENTLPAPQYGNEGPSSSSIVPSVQASTQDEYENSEVSITSSSAEDNGAVASINPTTTQRPLTETFWDQHKTWLKPVAIGAGGIGLIAIGMAVLKPKASERRGQSNRSLSGVPKRKKKNHKRRPKAKTGHKHKRKTAVALL